MMMKVTMASVRVSVRVCAVTCPRHKVDLGLSLSSSRRELRERETRRERGRGRRNRGGCGGGGGGCGCGWSHQDSLAFRVGVPVNLPRGIVLDVRLGLGAIYAIYTRGTTGISSRGARLELLRVWVRLCLNRGSLGHWACKHKWQAGRTMKWRYEALLLLGDIVRMRKIL